MSVSMRQHSPSKLTERVWPVAYLAHQLPDADVGERSFARDRVAWFPGAALHELPIEVVWLLIRFDSGSALLATAGNSLLVLDLAIELAVDGSESRANDGEQVPLGIRIAFDVNTDLTCLVILDDQGTRTLEFGRPSRFYVFGDG